MAAYALPTGNYSADDAAHPAQHRPTTSHATSLAATGANLMDPLHRLTVLETSLRTTAEALRKPSPYGAAAAPTPGAPGVGSRPASV
ncbi:hypothetical protein NGB36_08280 [Streptomyces sp. RB6PN25]|uniref:Uncharacterized protein n=1 Tax=Streptomyces humicola TaxID=2953240 RepID=A0ABT1PSE8_9ACTN|nr:hypothetical protein [Streptomyces humicola]MCQ4080599.1 hypothetical protein [Streptomyces humicola]